MRRLWMKKTLMLSVIAIALAAATAYAAIVSTIVSIGTANYVESLQGPGDLTFATLTFGPGDASAWHRHPGEVFAVVRSGAVTVENPCGGTVVYPAGQAFIEEPGHIHRAVNYTAGTAVLDVLYVVPQGSPRSIPVASPICIGPPASAEACMGEAWQTFTVPRVFRNQGDCVSWVESGRR